MADPVAQDAFNKVNTALLSINPAAGQQTSLVGALQSASDALATLGYAPVDSCGARLLASRDGVNAASAAAIAAGEPGVYVATHDGRVYTPEQMLVTLHRMLLGLGWTTSSTPPVTATPDPVPQPSGQAGVQVFPDISNYQSTISLSSLKAAGYSGLIAKIGQGASTSQGYGQTLDASWPTWRPQAQSLWPKTFLGYWYVGDSESPASQAARCKTALVDLTIPVELDWEVGGGSWTNLLAVLAAFQAAGINVTSLYVPNAYGTANGIANATATGLAMRFARYPNVNQPSPQVGQQAIPAAWWTTAYGGQTPDMIQFASDCLVLPGFNIDCNAFRGNMDQLAALIQGGGATAAPTITVPPGANPPIVTPASWRAQLDKGWLAAHQSTPWNREPQSLPLPQIVDMSKQQFPGKRVGWAFAAHLPGGAKRIEVQPNIAEYSEGNEAWFGFTFILSRNFPVNRSFWHVICQLKNDNDGSPPVSLQVKNGHLVLTGGYGHPTAPAEYDVNLCPVSALTFYDVQFHVKFSRYSSTGYVDVWVNGQPCVTGYHPATGTLYPVAGNPNASQSSYLKYGLYRDPSCPTEATVYHSGWAVGAQHGSVLLPAAG